MTSPKKTGVTDPRTVTFSTDASALELVLEGIEAVPAESGSSSN